MNGELRKSRDSVKVRRTKLGEDYVLIGEMKFFPMWFRSLFRKEELMVLIEEKYAKKKDEKRRKHQTEELVERLKKMGYEVKVE